MLFYSPPIASYNNIRRHVLVSNNKEATTYLIRRYIITILY
jgi:hypothetical protein